MNSKTLFIYNPLFKKTSLINYKGRVNFAKYFTKDGKTLGKLNYSYLKKGMSGPSIPEILPRKRLELLLSAFKIDTNKLD